MGLKVKSKRLKSPNSKQSKDVILKGQLDDKSNIEVKAHQQKLAYHSYVLSEAFDNYHDGNNVFRGVNIIETPENQLLVTLEGTRTEDLKKIVELLYKNETNCSNESKLLDLYVICDYYSFHKVLPVLDMRIKKLKVNKYFVALQTNEAVKKNDGKRIKECKKCLYKKYGEIMQNNTTKYSLNMLSESSVNALINDTSKYRLLDDELSNLSTNWILHDVEAREQIGDSLYSRLNVSRISEKTRENLQQASETIGRSPNSIDRYLQNAPPEGTLPYQYDSNRRTQSRSSSVGSFKTRRNRSTSQRSSHQGGSERFPSKSRYNDYSSAESLSPLNTPRSGSSYRARRESSGMRIIMPVENEDDDYEDSGASNSRITIMKENGDERGRYREYVEEKPQSVEREIIIKPRTAQSLENKNAIRNDNMKSRMYQQPEENKFQERVLIVHRTPSPQKPTQIQEKRADIVKVLPQNSTEPEVKEKVFIVRRTPSPTKKINSNVVGRNDVQYDYKVINPSQASKIGKQQVKAVEEKKISSFDTGPLQMDVMSETSSFEINDNSEKQPSRSPSPKAQERFDLMRLSNPYLRQSLIKKNVNPPNSNDRNSNNSFDEPTKSHSAEHDSPNVISMQKQLTFDGDRPYSPVPYEGELTVNKTFLLLFSDDVFTVRDNSAVALSLKDHAVLKTPASNRMKIYPPSTVSSSTGYAYYKKTNTVYATGGPPPSSKEVYCLVWNSPDLNTYGPDLIEGRHSHGAVCHRDYIFVAGGISESGEALDSVEYLNVHPNSSSVKWESRIKLPHANFGLAMCNSNNGFIIIGGIGPRGTGIRDVIEFDLATSEWNMLPQMNHARAFFQSAMLNDCIYVAGGKRHSDDITMSSVEYYQMGADSWVEITPLNCPLSHGVMVASFDQLFLLQGINDGPIVPIDIYDIKKEEWHRIMKSIGIKRVLYTAIASTD